MYTHTRPQATINSNNMEIKFPYQCFINNEFSDAVEGNTFTTINPTTEEPIATIAASGVDEVERAVAAAKVSNIMVTCLVSPLSRSPSIIQPG